MKVEVWSDFVCPFCFMGKTQLEQALESFPHNDQVDLEFMSYELEPETSSQGGKNINEAMAEKFNISVNEANNMNEQVGTQVREAGLPYNVEGMQPTNTFDAHRLEKYAEKHGKGTEMADRLFQAYFSDAELISDHDTLARLAGEVGLDEHAVMEMLQSAQFSQKVRADQLTAREIGVKGVPFFVFNEEYALSGGQTKEAFTEVLETLWKEEQKKPALKSLNPNSSNTSYCSDDSCETESEER